LEVHFNLTYDCVNLIKRRCSKHWFKICAIKLCFLSSFSVKNKSDKCQHHVFHHFSINVTFFSTFHNVNSQKKTLVSQPCNFPIRVSVNKSHLKIFCRKLKVFFSITSFVCLCLCSFSITFRHFFSEQNRLKVSLRT